MIVEDFDHRVLPFDETAAAHHGDIAAAREHGGRPISVADAQIAAICRSHDSMLATRNVSDFGDTGITVIDPWITVIDPWITVIDPWITVIDPWSSERS